VDEQRLADLLAWLDRRQRRFPAGAFCVDCGGRNRLLLCRSGKQVVCYRCRLRRRGRPEEELHHLGGRPGELTVRVPANLHRLLTELQRLWRVTHEPGSPEAILFDLYVLRVLGRSFGGED
jgi:hypothetical protein